MPSDDRVARSVALEQAYVHDVYEQFYDNPRSKPWPRVQAFLNDLEPGSIVCDVGCGNGKYLNVNTSIFNMGGDKALRLTEIAREKDNEVVALDNLALPYRDESLDAVLSIAVVHHLATTERRIRAIRELARVLRIGGRIIISVWAMEQNHRKFESQDVLVPWHRPQHLSTPSLELTSTTNTSEDDGPPPYHAYTQSDTDSNKSNKSKGLTKKRGKARHKGRSIDPGKNSSPSSSSLSSPNESCYSFVRRAIQKLAGGRRVGVHRPWFLESWTTCAKEPSQKRYDPDGCDCCDCTENIQDLPIELRRIDDEEVTTQRRQTFPSSQLVNDISSGFKSKSLTNIKSSEVTKESKPQEDVEKSVKEQTANIKPKLVKQKKSICDEDNDEALDQPTEMQKIGNNGVDLKLHQGRTPKGGVLKQRSLNEELMSTERLKEKEKVRQNIQKQASLNEDLIYHRHGFDSFKDSIFSVTTQKRFQLIKTGFTNKIKSSTTNIEKVTSQSLKNGFVRMFQNWKSADLISPTIPENEVVDTKTVVSTEEKKETTTERRHSKEDGSDSSKDSSLQSDTSVDSEDSFASVIFVPKSDPMSPSQISPGPTSPRLKNTSVPNSPRIKQSSCPTSPRIKSMPLAVYPLTKQLSSPKPSTIDLTDKSDWDHKTLSTTETKTLAQKYSVPQIPEFRRTSLNTPSNNSTLLKPTTSPEQSLSVVDKMVIDKKVIDKTIPDQLDKTTLKIPNVDILLDKPKVDIPMDTSTAKTDTRAERLKKIKELLTQKPGFGGRTKSNFPLVRHASINNDKMEPVAKAMPKLLSLELFNPETDDKDSDSSAVSSPDSVESVVSVKSEVRKSPSGQNKFVFPSGKSAGQQKLLEAAADVANSLDHAVDRVIKMSPKARKRQVQSGEVISIIQRSYCSSDTEPLLSNEITPTWREDCHKYLTDFADRLSEKLLKEIDQYQEKTRRQLSSSSFENIDDPYIHRLSEELDDLSKLSAEIQKQNEYLSKLSASDHLFNIKCSKCHKIQCRCCGRTANKSLESSSKAADSSSKVSSDVFSSNLKDDSTNKPNELTSDKLVDEGLSCVVKLSSSKNSIRMGTSTDSCDSEKGSSTNSMISSVATSINFGPSQESTDGLSDKLSGESQKDTCSISRYSDEGSTASLVSCPDWKPARPNPNSRLTKDSDSTASLDSKRKDISSIYSDTSQDSLPSDNMGGEITYHRFYHVFREGELDQLIEKYVENLHIISSYYDHASWCIIAEKVQVWTI